MRSKPTPRNAAVFLAGLLLLAGCATYQQGRPAFYDLPGVERLAVWSFGDPEFADQVAEVLVHCSRWTVYDRADVEGLIEEQQLQHSERFDAKTAVEVGKLAGVNAVVFGEYDTDRAVVKVVDVKTGQYHVYKNVAFDPGAELRFKAWLTCRHLVPHAVRFEGGRPTFVWCGNNVDRVRPRRLP